MAATFTYHHLAERIRSITHEPPELLHVNAGLLIWVASALVLRRPLRWPGSLAIVLVFAVGNEVMDRMFWGEWRASTLVDIFNTCGWPALLCALLQLAPRLRG